MTLQFWTADDLQSKLGILVDKADNYLTFRDAHMPPQLKLDAFANCLQDLRDELKSLYFELGGEDVWDGT